MLSIVVVHYKDWALLKLCLLSLQRTIRRTKYEIITVESESDGETPELISKEFPGVRVIAFSENTGYAKAVNAGIKNAQGDYILILNFDIIAEEGAIDEMVEFMRAREKEERIGILGPRLLGFDNKVQYSAFRFYTPWMIVLRRTFLGKIGRWRKEVDKFLLKDKNIESTSRPQAVDWVMGSAMLVSADALKRVGLMDERFFMYFEDVDWARRFWENGYRVVYFPKARMYHYHGQASRRKSAILGLLTNKMARTHLRSAFLYFKKYRFKTIHYV